MSAPDAAAKIQSLTPVWPHCRGGSSPALIVVVAPVWSLILVVTSALPALPATVVELLELGALVHPAETVLAVGIVTPGWWTIHTPCSCPIDKSNRSLPGLDIHSYGPVLSWLWS